MNNAKILFFDIETTPLLSYAWGPMYETNLIKVIEESKILSYSAKWFEGKHITKGWPDYRGYKGGVNDDTKIVKDIWELFNEAEIIVVQNGKSFDVKSMNSRFISHGLKPPAPYKVVDTKIEAKKYIRLPSYSLDNMCEYFGIGKKQEHEGFPLWEKCMAGDLKAWKRMLKYNKHDVVLTEQLYLKLRPYMAQHPNLNLLNNTKKNCPNCGQSDVQRRGYGINAQTKYERLHCQTCGAWFKGANIKG